MEYEPLAPAYGAKFLLILGPAVAKSLPRSLRYFLPLRDHGLIPESIVLGYQTLPKDFPEEDRGGYEHPPRDFHVGVARDDSLPEQAVRPFKDLVQLALRGSPGVLSHAALCDVGHDPHQVPLAGAGGPDDDLLAQPVHAIGPDDPEFVLIAASPSGDGGIRNAVHLLMVRGKLVVPEPTLVGKGGEAVDGVVPELGRRAYHPVVPSRLFGAGNPGPPQEHIGSVQRVQDQLVILEFCRVIVRYRRCWNTRPQSPECVGHAGKAEDRRGRTHGDRHVQVSERHAEIGEIFVASLRSDVTCPSNDYLH